MLRKVMLIFILIGVALGLFAVRPLAAAPSAAATNGFNVPIDLHSQTGGTVETVVVSGTVAYIGQGPRLVVVDISSPAAMVQMSRSEPLRGLVVDIRLSGNFAYVVTDVGDLAVFNITNPSAIAHVATLNVCSQATALEVVGSRAFVGCSNTFYELSISTPATPNVTAQLNLPVATHDFSYDNNVIAVAGVGTGIALISVSTAGAPELRGDYNTAGVAYGVFLTGTTLYVADFTNVKVFNVSDLDNPSLIGTGNVSLGNPRDVHVSGSRAYVVSNGYFAILNISNLASITQVSILSIPDTDFMDTLVPFSGGFLLAASNGGLRSINISTEASPAISGTFAAHGNIRDVAYLNSNFAVAATDWSGLTVFDISNPAAPSVVTRLDTTNRAAEIGVFGNYVYLLEQVFVVANVRIYDLTNPAAPVEVGLISGFDTSEAMLVHGSLLVVGENTISNPNLTLYDLSTTPAAPVKLGELTMPNAVTDMKIVGNRLYLAVTNGAYIYDISNPNSPTFLGAYIAPLGSSYRSIAVSGNLLMLAAPQYLGLVDISDPANPQFIKFVGLLGCLIESLTVRYPGVVAGCSNGHLHVISIDNPSAAAIGGSTYNGGVSREQAYNNDVMLAAGGRQGFIVLKATVAYRVFLPVLVR